MAARGSHPSVAWVACLVADAALVIWTLALWWKPSRAEISTMHRALPWAADSCFGATFLGVAITLVIAVAILAIAMSIGSERVQGLRVASVGVAALTSVAVVLPWVVNGFSHCTA